MPHAAGEATERAARESFGRLVAFLAARSRDVAGAEDALGDALVSALERWPLQGVPSNPDAWLLTVARHRLIDRARRTGVEGDAVQRLLLARAEAEEAAADPSGLPDRRLALLLACAHPSIDPGARTPLMLHCVLGVSTERIASAFLATPAAMAKRLGRAKRKLREAGVAFEVPGPDELVGRLDGVLAAIYAAFGLGWDDAPGAAPGRSGLTAEAIWLGRLVERLLPGEPEAMGLLALMLFSDARRDARRDPTGGYLPIGSQTVRRWSAASMDEAEGLLRRASTCGRIGRYQLEAAIQAVHVDRRRTGLVDWPAIVRLYEGLLAHHPTIGAAVGRAAALGEAGQAVPALEALGAIDPRAVAVYQPFWATRAHLLLRLGRLAEAAEDYGRAAGLSEDGAVRAYLLARQLSCRR